MSITDDLKGLDIAQLISAPLIGAANAQVSLATVTANFIQNVGINQDGDIRTVEFKYEDRDETGAVVKKKVDVPLLSVVNVPNLSVKSVDVAFSMEVKSQSTDKSSVESNTSFSAGFNSRWSPWSCKISGSVATKSENTRSTDKSSKYDIKVSARDDGMPEGLSRVLDMLASNISPNAAKKV